MPTRVWIILRNFLTFEKCCTKSEGKIASKKEIGLHFTSFGSKRVAVLNAKDKFFLALCVKKKGFEIISKVTTKCFHWKKLLLCWNVTTCILPKKKKIAKYFFRKITIELKSITCGCTCVRRNIKGPTRRSISCWSADRGRLTHLCSFCSCSLGSIKFPSVITCFSWEGMNFINDAGLKLKTRKTRMCGCLLLEGVCIPQGCLILFEPNRLFWWYYVKFLSEKNNGLQKIRTNCWRKLQSRAGSLQHQLGYALKGQQLCPKLGCCFHAQCMAQLVLFCSKELE